MEILDESSTNGKGTRTMLREESKKTVSTIIIFIGTPQLYLITSYPDSDLRNRRRFGTLHDFRKHFEHETLANELFLKKQYFGRKLKRVHPIATHLKEASNSPISEDQVVTLCHQATDPHR